MLFKATGEYNILYEEFHKTVNIHCPVWESFCELPRQCKESIAMMCQELSRPEGC